MHNNSNTSRWMNLNKYMQDFTLFQNFADSCLKMAVDFAPLIENWTHF